MKRAQKWQKNTENTKEPMQHYFIPGVTLQGLTGMIIYSILEQVDEPIVIYICIIVLRREDKY